MELTSELSPPRYPVVFRAGSARPVAGSLVVESDRLHLAGRADDGSGEVSLCYSDLVEVRVGRAPAERLHGRPTVLLVRREGPSVQVEPLGPGLLHELADLLAALASEVAAAEERVAVLVPLRPGRLERAQELLAQGPPFDPAALGFSLHQVYLREAEAVFVFAGRRVRERLERSWRDPSLWQVGLAWRGCIGGRPRVAAGAEAEPAAADRLVYSWVASRTD